MLFKGKPFITVETTFDIGYSEQPPLMNVASKCTMIIYVGYGDET
jgi:hypothetical protein